LDAELRAYNARIAARADVLAAKDALGLAVGTAREDAARRLYEAREAAWRAVAAPPDSVPAFPGAIGAGATAMQDCFDLVAADPANLVVHRVQNLNTSGAGSLDAVEAAMADNQCDVVIFDTAGTILNSGRLNYDTLDNVYFAFQTAKGGFAVDFNTANGGGMFGATHGTGGGSGFLVRYGRFWCEINAANTNDCVSWDMRNNDGGGNVYLDHILALGGNDEVLSFPDGAKDFGQRLTVGFSIVYGGADHHKAGGIFGWGSYPTCNATGSTAYRNLYNLTGQRSPPNTGHAPACSQFINNMMVNPVNRQSTSSDSTHADYDRNFTDATNAVGLAILDSMSFNVRIGLDPPPSGVGPDCRPGGTPPDECIKLYVAASLWELSGTPLIDTTADMWRTVCDEISVGCGHGTIDSTYYRSYTPLFGTPKWDAPRIQAALVPDSLVGGPTYDLDAVNVGPNGWIECSGASLAVGAGHGELTGAGFTRHQDKVDSLATSDYLTGATRSMSNTYTDYMPGGVLPTLTATGPRCDDTDGDGMPDQWEVAHNNVNVNVADAASDLDEDLYPAIFEYLNGSDPDQFTFADGSEGGAGPVVTFGNGRWIYQDTLIAYQQITAGGADTDSVFMPDTSQYSPTELSPFTFIPKNIGTPARGDTVLILINDSVPGSVAKQLDSGQVDSLAGTIAVGEGEWSRCASRGICTDSLRNRDIP
jgi:hypothetical protein